jgi:uncharacterized protein (TIGR02145 family)
MQGEFKLARIQVVKRPQGFYLRWYYNGWHYWQFLQGGLTYITDGQKHRTYGSRTVTVSSGQITISQAAALRTILNTPEVHIYTDGGWASVRLEAGSVQLVNNYINGYEMIFTVNIGSRGVSATGFSPVKPIIVPPVQDQCEVVIGSQIWMCKNWDGEFPASKVYNGLEANRAIYGGLYTYDQIMAAGFCPAGWHIPSLADYEQLFADNGGVLVAGGHMKEAGTDHWDNPNTDADNSTALAFLGGGAWMMVLNPDWSPNLGYHNGRSIGYFWAASPAGYNYVIALRYDNGEVLVLPLVPAPNPAYTPYFSVRLIKDAPAITGEPDTLTAVGYSATAMQLNWVRHTTDEDGFHIERSTDHGVTFAPMATVGAGVVAYVDDNLGAGLTPKTDYVYRVRAYRGGSLTRYSNEATGWTAMNFSLATAGNGSGVSKFVIEINATTRLTISGTGKFYDDAAGTTNENTDRTYTAGAHTVYVKVPSGAANISIFSQNSLLGIDWDNVVIPPFATNPNSPIVTARLSELSTSIYYFYIRGNNTVSGDLSQLSPNMTVLYCMGQNTISGNLNHFSGSLVSLILYGNNTLTGNVTDLPSTVVAFDVGGLNTISGNIADIPATCTSFQCYGGNTLTGDLANLAANYTVFGVAGFNTITGDIYYIPAVCWYFWVAGNNTLYGNLSGVPSTMQHFEVEGQNTISGNISSMPASCIFFLCYGNNTITGNLNSLPASAYTFNVTGYNTISGTLSALPNTLVQFYVMGYNTISGSLHYIPANAIYFILGGYNTVNDYTAVTWSNQMREFYCAPVSGAGLSSAEVDALLIDAAVSDWTLSGIQGGSLWLAGFNGGRTSASDAAVATLTAKGVTVQTNAGGGLSDYFLPSHEESNSLFLQLKGYGVGGFADDIYWTSTEYGASDAEGVNFASGLFSGYAKSDQHRVRACRRFTSSADYALRDTGQGGGLIFIKINNYDGTYTYYEAAPTDQSAAKLWSNVANTEIGATAQGVGVGDGVNNTAAIIGQGGHTDSAAKLCDDLVI